MADSFVTLAPDWQTLSAVQERVANVKDGLVRVIVRSLNKVGRAERAQMVKWLAKKTGLKQKEIREKNTRIRIASYDRWETTITTKGKTVALIKFKARQTKAGVTWQNPETGARELVKKAFIYTTKSGRTGVFIRSKLGVDAGFQKQWGMRMGKVTSGRKRAFAHVTPEGYAWRLPLEQKYGPSIVDSLLPEVPRFGKDAEERLVRELEVQAKLVAERG